MSYRIKEAQKALNKLGCVFNCTSLHFQIIFFYQYAFTHVLIGIYKVGLIADYMLRTAKLSDISF